MRQRDTISPKLFTLVFENVFKKLDWTNREIKIDGKYLSHLRFVDEILILSDDIEDMTFMLQELKEETKMVVLKMNMKIKTKSGN